MTRIHRYTTVLFVVLAVTMAIPVAWAQEADDAPPEVRREITDILQKRVVDLVEAKDDEGYTYRRGNYSNNFHRIDDSTYQVAFHQGTIEDQTLVTERYLLTFRNEDGKWVLAGEELQDTYRGLSRQRIGDEDFFAFERFSLDREGLRVTASGGQGWKDYRNGKVEWILITSDDLAYEYRPPIQRDRYVYQAAMRHHQNDLIFEPLWAAIRCDPGSCEELLATSFSGLEDIPQENLGDRAAKIERELEDDARKRLRDYPFSGFRRDWEEGNEYYSITIKKAGVGDHYVGLIYDNFEGREVRFWASDVPGVAMFQYHSEAVRASDSSPIELERRMDREARDYDLEGLRGIVELALDTSDAMTGDISYTLTARRELEELPFAIARLQAQGPIREAKNPKLRINSIRNENGEEMTWVRLGAFQGLIVLPEPVPEGEEIMLRIQFENRDVIEKFTASHSYMARGGWLPLVRFGDMIHEFDLTVKVPDRYQTLGIGRKVSEEAADGVSTTRWVAQNAVDFPTVIFGVYVSTTSKVKATKMDGTEIPVTVHVDKNTMGNAQLLVDKERAGDMGDEFFQVVSAGGISPKILGSIADEAANSINFYRELYGLDYPYGKLDLVNDPLGFLYGQAPSSIVYLGTGAFFGEGKLAATINLSGRDYNFFRKGLVPHEVAHQWWGSLITNANDRNYWFVESLAEYSSALFEEFAYGKKSYQAHVDAWRAEILDNEPGNALQDGYTVWQGDNFGPYRAALYAKGPYALHILRETLNDDKRFFKFLKDLAQGLEGEEIVTRDIQTAMEKSLGGGMEWFFDQWIRGIGIPELTVTYDTRQNEDGSYVVKGEVRQRILYSKDKEVLEGEYFRGIVPITVDIGKKEYVRFPVVLKGEVTAFEFPVPRKPKDVVINKEGEFLAHNIRKD